jgi:hypothetical protein
VYFLNGGVASMTTVMQDGSMVEIATVGDEGMVGIKYTHGRIRILDRKGLEETSCECYATVRGHFDRLGL